jgi:hypothetical protein
MGQMRRNITLIQVVLEGILFEFDDTVLNLIANNEQVNTHK